MLVRGGLRRWPACFLPAIERELGTSQAQDVPRPRVQISTRHMGNKQTDRYDASLDATAAHWLLPQGMRGAVGGGWVDSGRRRRTGGLWSAGIRGPPLGLFAHKSRSPVQPGAGWVRSLSGLHSVGSACCTGGGDSTRPPRCHRHSSWASPPLRRRNKTRKMELDL